MVQLVPMVLLDSVPDGGFVECTFRQLDDERVLLLGAPYLRALLP